MARAARNAGFEVHVATRVHRLGPAIESEGFILHPLGWRRGSLDPFHIFSMIMEVRAIYRRVQPKIVHHVALVPTVVGSIAAFGLPIERLNALAGLGFAFSSQTPGAKILRIFVERILIFLLSLNRSIALVQNPDDKAFLELLGLAEEKIALIPGSGVDTDALTPLPEPPWPITIGYVGRLLKDKGVEELVAAHDLLRQRGLPINLLIAGDQDPANPASVSDERLGDWKSRPGVSVLGHVKDISAFWAKAHIAVLPSYREGLPLSLLEAAACGRPLIATDVPGCREIARNNLNALTVPPRDANALADAIARLSQDGEMRRRFAAASRALVEQTFSAQRIAHDIVDLYEHLLLRAAPADV